MGRFVTFWNSGGRIGYLRGSISGPWVCVIVDQVLALGLYRCICGGGSFRKLLSRMRGDCGDSGGLCLYTRT